MGGKRKGEEGQGRASLFPFTPSLYPLCVSLYERLPALQHPAFRRWVVGSFFSNVGGSLQIWAVFWQLDHLTHRPEAVGTVGLIRVVPLLVFGLLAGHLADTRERPKVLLVTRASWAASRSCSPP